jgi:hypothetical protein
MKIILSSGLLHCGLKVNWWRNRHIQATALAHAAPYFAQGAAHLRADSAQGLAENFSM